MDMPKKFLRTEKLVREEETAKMKLSKMRGKKHIVCGTKFKQECWSSLHGPLLYTRGTQRQAHPDFY